jgi:hypothetical protein
VERQVRCLTPSKNFNARSVKKFTLAVLGRRGERQINEFAACAAGERLNETMPASFQWLEAGDSNVDLD